ncbi:MAG: DMT family transporter [Chloroflexota bacterium]
MIGVIIALITALAWAGSSTLLKYLSARVDTISLNTTRLWVGSVILLVFVFLSGRSFDLSRADVLPILMVAVSGIVAIAAGDTIYIKSLSFMDVSRAFPLAQCTFPMLALFTAIFFLGESFTWFNILGASLVVLSIYLLTRTDRRVVANKNIGRGTALALIAALLWASGAVALKLGITNMDNFVAAAIRISVATTAVTVLALSQRSRGSLQFIRYGARSTMLAMGAGILTYGVAAAGYVTAMQLIGVGKTVLLTASAPLFLLPFSVFILKERLSLRAIVGVFVSVAGMCLVAL